MRAVVTAGTGRPGGRRANMKREEVQELVRLRIEQARGALRDAELLRQGGGTAQSTVNRSYYAMFYVVLGLLHTVGRVPSKHQGVLTLFDTQFVKQGVFSKEMSATFHKAFEFRLNAGYTTTRPVPLDEAESLLRDAGRFVGTIEEYPRGELYS